jgi:hypothetical protein
MPAYLIQDNRSPAEIRIGHLLVPHGSQSWYQCANQLDKTYVILHIFA